MKNVVKENIVLESKFFLNRFFFPITFSKMNPCTYWSLNVIEESLVCWLLYSLTDVIFPFTYAVYVYALNIKLFICFDFFLTL